MKFILPILLALSLQGCAFLSKKPEPPATEKVTVDSTLLEYCPRLPDKVVLNKEEDILLVYVDLANKYGICANKQAAGVKAIKKFGGLE